jgi:hypothetical protein
MLRPFRQVESLNIDFMCPFTQERGGFLSIGSASGMIIAEYAVNPSGAIPLGLQYNDIEFIDYSRQIDPQRLRATDDPCGIVGIITQGDFETDWVHLVGSVNTGDPAYVGPSGTITNSSSFGGYQIGKFLSQLKSDPHLVTFRGLGFSFAVMNKVTNQPLWTNNPADRVFVAVDGFIKVRIDPNIIMRSQAGLI